jgi:hypothetical protein
MKNNLDIEKYFKKGITITKKKDCYEIFTIATQHFKVNSLNELTNELFEEKIKLRTEANFCFRRDDEETRLCWKNYKEQDRKIIADTFKKG